MEYFHMEADYITDKEIKDERYYNEGLGDIELSKLDLSKVPHVDDVCFETIDIYLKDIPKDAVAIRIYAMGLLGDD